MGTQSSAIEASEHAVSREPDGRWKKGASPNAGGRPRKDRAFSAALDAELDKKVGKKTKRELMAATAVRLAIEGDMAAAKFVADRTEGLPIQRHSFDDDDLRQQAEALAEEAQRPVEEVESLLRSHLTLVK